MATHYEVLGIAPGASTAEVRAAYHRLARRHHPDFHAGASADDQARSRRRMQEINEAWRVLGHAARRTAYDASLRQPPRERFVASGASGGADIWGIDDDELAQQRWEERERWAPSPEPGGRRPLLVAPALMVAAAIVLFVLWMMVGASGLLVLSAASGIGGTVLFVVAPLVVMVGARRDE